GSSPSSTRRRTARVERRGDVAGNAARRHQHGVEADIANAGIGIAREPGLGGADDARALAIGHRPGGVIERVARLDLDEYEQRAAARDDVDLAERAPPAPRQDAKALGDQERRRATLGRDAGAERDLPLRTRALQRAPARPLSGHRRA